VYYIWTKEVEKERASIWDWGRWSRTRGGWASGQYEGPLILPPICFCLGFQKRSINLTLTFSHSLPLFPLLLIYFFYFWSKFFLFYFILIYFPNLAAARVVRASPAVAVTTEMWSRLFANVISWVRVARVAACSTNRTLAAFSLSLCSHIYVSNLFLFCSKENFCFVDLFAKSNKWVVRIQGFLKKNWYDCQTLWLQICDMKIKREISHTRTTKVYLILRSQTMLILAYLVISRTNISREYFQFLHTFKKIKCIIQVQIVTPYITSHCFP